MSDLTPTYDAAGEGRFFEHFELGARLEHAVPRTLTAGDVALYQALYGGRNPLFCALPVAAGLGLGDIPLDDWLVFHIVFGKSVPDISRNAVANLGYAEGRFLAPGYGKIKTVPADWLWLRRPAPTNMARRWCLTHAG